MKVTVTGHIVELPLLTGDTLEAHATSEPSTESERVHVH